MNSQNIISNEFDLNWSTSFSYTSAFVIFSKEKIVLTGKDNAI
jgi:hypothetical protein